MLVRWESKLVTSIGVSIAVGVHIAGFIIGLTSQEWKHGEVWSRLARGLLSFGGCLLHLSMSFCSTCAILMAKTPNIPEGTSWTSWTIPFVHLLVGCTSLGSFFIEDGKRFFLVGK